MSIIEKIPKTVEFYPHVAKKIEACWDSPEAAQYLEKVLLKDRFRDRQGFNISVWFELKDLLQSSQYNTVDFSKEQPFSPGPKEVNADLKPDSSDEDFKEQLRKIHALVELSHNFSEVMPEIEPAILYMLKAVRMTVFQCARNGKEIVATFKSSREKQEIRVPFSPTSIAGFVALSQKPVLIKNLYSDNELKAVHPKLQFDRSFSERSGLKHRTMICVPIKAEKILLGVLQVINRSDGSAFSVADEKRAMLVAQMIGNKFRAELQSTQGPYDKLIQQDLISLQDLENIERKAKQSKQTITSLLVEKGVSEAEIGVSLEHYYQVPYLGYQDNLTLPKEFFSKLQIPYLQKNLWLPIGGDNEEVVILLDDPSDNEKIIEIQRIINSRNYVFRVGTPEVILRYLEAGADNIGKANLFEVIEQMDDEKSEKRIASPSEVVAGEKVASGLEDSSPIVQLVNQMIAEAARLSGSDIHIEPSKNNQPGVVRLRVDGVCRELFTFPGNNVEAVIARIKVMSRLDLSQRRIPQDGKCKLKVNGRELELRVATIPTVNGESVVLRLLAGGGALPMKKLNLTKHNMQGILDATSKPHGLFLVVGPTGSGKTTTLHAVLAHLNTPDRKIWTAEDPVEITQAGLQQVQINNKIGFDFMAAMRAFLRADPDCILIGEMRDQETASIGIEASLTGHLVLSTLHTNSAPETITRLLDLGMDPINFSDALLGILAQRLIRTLCGKCKEVYTPDAKELQKLIRIYGQDAFDQLNLNTDELKLYRSKGCDDCGGSGYRGRTGIHELLLGTPEMKKLVYENVPMGQLLQQAIKDGMRTLLQDGVYKILKGDTDYKQLMKVATE